MVLWSRWSKGAATATRRVFATAATVTRAAPTARRADTRHASTGKPTVAGQRARLKPGRFVFVANRHARACRACDPGPAAVVGYGRTARNAGVALPADTGEFRLHGFHGLRWVRFCGSVSRCLGAVCRAPTSPAAAAGARVGSR